MSNKLVVVTYKKKKVALIFLFYNLITECDYLQCVHLQRHPNLLVIGTVCIHSQEKDYVNKWYRWKSESLEIYRDNNNSIWTVLLPFKLRPLSWEPLKWTILQLSKHTWNHKPCFSRYIMYVLYVRNNWWRAIELLEQQCTPEVVMRSRHKAEWQLHLGCALFF